MRCEQVAKWLRSGWNWMFLSAGVLCVGAVVLEAVLIGLGARVIGEYGSNHLAEWLVTTGALSLFEVGGNGVTGWAARKGGKKWRYGLVLCVLLYCLILSVSIYILHQTRSTLNTISTELTDSCESSALLGSLQLAYDLAYQSARGASQSIFTSDISIIPSLAGLAKETELLKRLEEAENCGGMCSVRPRIFTSGEMPQHSCRRPLLALLKAGQKTTLGLLISALIVKTLAFGLFYVLVFRKRGRQAYLPKFPMLIGPPLEQPQEQPPGPETPPAEVSFSKPVSPASRPPPQDEDLSLSSSEEKAESDD